MTKRYLKHHSLDLTKTISQIVEDASFLFEDDDENERLESRMKVEYDHNQASSDDNDVYFDPLELQPYHGLSHISQDTLQRKLQPIVEALERIDASQLLDLKPAAHGPRLDSRRCCESIYEKIKPTMTDSTLVDSHSCVRYLHINEISDQYSIGIFVFAPHAKIPLHDHPDMCVLSRVLYGDLERHSLDLARENNTPSSRTKWFGSWFSRLESYFHKLPDGSKQAYKNHVDHLQAPAVTMLFPYEGNLHEFVAGPNGAAVLDVLLPPYDNVQNRDCTFYEIHDMNGQTAGSSDKEPCFVVPTGQPETFHCVSGRFGDLGEDD